MKQDYAGKGFPTRAPLGFNSHAYPRVELKHDIRGADGRLLAEAGATGIRVGAEPGRVMVLFDEDQDRHIELSGCGSLLQFAPTVDVKVEFPCGSGKFL